MIVETNAASTLDRYKQLVATNAITKDDFEKAELNYQVARLDVGRLAQRRRLDQRDASR